MSEMIVDRLDMSVVAPGDESLADKEPEQLKAEILAIKEHARKTATMDAIAIGQRLRELRQRIPFGSWGQYIRDNLDYSERTAENLVKLAETYEGDRMRLVEHLDMTKALLLVGVTEADREQLIESGTAESMSTRELQEEIRRLRAETEKQQMTIDELMKAEPQAPAEPATDPQVDQLLDELHQVNDALRATQDERDNARRKAEDLETSVKLANRSAEDFKRRASEIAGEAEKSQLALTAAQAQVAKLEAELENARSNPSAEVPKEVQEELNALRAQKDMAGHKANFAAGLEQVKQGFARMKEAIAGMENGDAYRTAALRALEVMKAQMGGM